MKIESSSGVLRQVLAFAALVVGKEDKSPLIEPFQKDDSRRRMSFTICVRQGHRIRLPVPSRAHRFFEPDLELLDRVRQKIFAMQAVQCVLLAQASNIE